MYSDLSGIEWNTDYTFGMVLAHAELVDLSDQMAVIGLAADKRKLLRVLWLLADCGAFDLDFMDFACVMNEHTLKAGYDSLLESMINFSHAGDRPAIRAMIATIQNEVETIQAKQMEDLSKPSVGVMPVSLD